jgi:hypothetical protein
MADPVFHHADFVVGHAFPAHRYFVDAAACDAFTRTFGHSAVRGAPDATVPGKPRRSAVRPAHPTLVASYQPMHAVFKWPDGVVHAREKLTLSAPVYPGEPLEAEISVKDSYLKNDKKFVVLEIAIRKLENRQTAMVVERTLVWPI